MKKYNKDYKLVPKVLKNGKISHDIEYAGQYYTSSQSSSELIKVKIACLILALSCDAVLISIGLLNTAGSRVFYIIIPYACLFLPALYCFMGTINLVTSGNRLEYAVYDKSVNRIFRSIVGQIIISSIAIMGNTGYIISQWNNKILNSDIVFLFGLIIFLILNLVMLRVRKKIKYEKE